MSDTTIEFIATPQSPRGLKISDPADNGGGYRVTLEMDEQQFTAWAKLAKLSGHPMRFSAEPL